MAIEVKCCTAKRTHVPVGPAKFDVNRCNESLLLGEKPDFWPVSKFNTVSLPHHGILLVKSMLRYDRQTKPGLVALYDIRPGNGAGPFTTPEPARGCSNMRIKLRVKCQQ